ncbi:serine endopeptidase [Paramyrothecium foliicola]|nr:serine endopeptidase [Paramyrothecium foliicola]
MRFYTSPNLLAPTMRLNRLAATLPFLGGTLALENTAEEQDGLKPVSKSFILEYSQAHLRKRQEEVSSTPGIEVVKTFDSNVFAGVSVVTEDFNVDSLAALPGVVKVWANELIVLPHLEFQNATAPATTFNYSTHNATGVDRLHKLGILGKGVKVGVVDTGIDYNHIALGGGYGEGFKVAGGWDVVGDGFYPAEPRIPDEDHIDVQGHGIHVAGIVAGKTEFWQGVAPEATLYAYKVFSRNRTTSADALIEAFLRAYEDGVDIITASIGGDGGWSDNVWAEVADRLVEEGVVVTISAGNSGSQGPFHGSSGSSGKNVIAVASTDTETFPVVPFNATITADGASNTTTLYYAPGELPFPSTVQDWPIVPLTLDSTVPDDACTSFAPGSYNFSQAVPLVRRGGCTFSIKHQNLVQQGAQYILFYNNENPLLTIPIERVGLTTSEAGEFIIHAVNNAAAVTVSFNEKSDEVAAMQFANGGRPSPFTSWGGLFDLQLKPDIAAPGGDIYSAFPGGIYRTASGTSMACPYVAGVAALWIGTHGGRSVNGKGFAKQLTQRIISSGMSLPWSNGTVTTYDWTAPAVQVGNGLVNAWKILQYDTRLEFDKIALNDTRYFSRYHDISVINNGDKAVSYDWAVEHSAGIEAVGWLSTPQDGTLTRLKTLTELAAHQFDVEVNLPRGFTLQPGERKTVSVNFRNPDNLGWNSSALPVYGGKVFVVGDNGERLSVPFFGVGADLRKTFDPISYPGYPYSVSGPNQVPILEDSSYSFNLSLDAQDFPQILNKVKWGSREVRWDVFEADWNERQWSYPPIVGERGYVGSVAAWTGPSRIFDPATGDSNSTFSFPVRNVFRHTPTFVTPYSWFGKLANGTQIGEGRYVIRFAILKPFGQPEAADNWEVLKVPEIEVTGRY